jgi:hypothetical protein
MIDIYDIHHHLSPKWRSHIQRCTDSATYITRIYSRLVEGGHKTSLGPHTLGARPSLSHKADNTVHISRYRLPSSMSRLEDMGPGFTSPGERFSYVPVETYSLPVLIAIRDDPSPCFALGESLTFYHSRLCTLTSYLVIGVSLQNSKLQKVNPVSIATC